MTTPITDVPVQSDTNLYETLPRLLADAAANGIDIGDLLAHACSEATRLLPRGMALTANRSGSWEAGHIEALTDPDAVDVGPGPAPLDVECDRCGAPAGQMCWNPRTYVDNKHPHQERIDFAGTCTFYAPGSGWML
ncbi:zinc finger domain-containing protein [Angustibacter luteus]|uniref:DNA-binding phage zinc finger domain-containing protein n=1 Tax=Angustibacter luteus TaxID=658456 RepID=A0ABW1JJQ9_9ACTN